MQENSINSAASARSENSINTKEETCNSAGDDFGSSCLTFKL